MAALIVTLCAYAQQGYVFGHVGLCMYVCVCMYVSTLNFFLISAWGCRDDSLVKKVWGQG